MTHRKGQKLIYQLFLEKEAFTVTLRLSNKQFAEIYDKKEVEPKKLIDYQYPCNDGGWIHFRIQYQSRIKDIHILLAVKCGFEED
ncbi:TPA: DUF3788 family protein [Streptococcus suis]